MPWTAEDFIRGGQGSLKAFNGRIRRIDRAVPVSFNGKSQLQRQLHFYDIDPLSVVAEKGFVLAPERTFTATMRESDRKSSTLAKLTIAWIAFGKSIGMEIPEGLIDRMVRYERKEIPGNDPNDDTFASGYLLPVRIIDDSVPTETDRMGGEAVSSESLLTKDVVEAIVAAVKDGSTVVLIRRELMANPAARQVIAGAGGIEPVLKAAVEHDVLTLTDGTYRVVVAVPVVAV